VETTAAHVHDLSPAADLLHGVETVVYAEPDTRELRSETRYKAGGSASTSPSATGSAECCQTCQRADWMADLKLLWPARFLLAGAHIRGKVQFQFRVIKWPLGFQKTCLRGMLMNHGIVHVLSALSNPFRARSRMLFSNCSGDQHAHCGYESPHVYKLRPPKRQNKAHHGTARNYP
jgi:IS5 family transposase